MNKITFPFIGEAYTSRSKNISCSESINFYPEIEKTGKAVIALIARPGLKYLTTYAGNGGNRGMYPTAGDRAFYIIANTLVEFDVAGVATKRGNLNTFFGQCSMADNGKQLMIVDGTFGYIYDLKDNKLTLLNSVDYPEFAANLTSDGDGNTIPTGGVSHVAFLNGYFVVNKNNVSQYNWFWSNQYDGLTWDASNVASAEASPDGLNALIENNNELIFFGNKSVEVFYNCGDADQPFMRVAGGHLNIGCYAPASVDRIGQSIFWLGSNEQGSGIVWMATGYQPSRISNHAIEYLISIMTRTDDVVGWCYQQEGHSFYVLTFPSGFKTIVYDMSTGMWHIRTTGSYPYWLAQNHCFMGTKNYVGDINNGNIYYLDFDTYTDNGTLFETVRTCQHLHRDRKRVFFGSLEIDMERGVGLTNDSATTTTESDPQAMLGWSDDGGVTWSSWYAAAIGKIGAYLTRIKWNRLGCSRDRIFSVKIVSPVKRVIVGAVMETTVEGD